MNDTTYFASKQNEKIEKADPKPTGVVIIGKFDAIAYYDDPRFIEDHNLQVVHDGQFIGDGAGFVFNKAEMDAINLVAKEFKIKKVGKTRAAFAALTVSDAVMAKMAYTGTLDFKVIDMDKMEEIV